MPTETRAFLVDPNGHAPQAIDEDDFKRIRQYLDLRHSANDEMCEAVHWLLHISTTEKGTDDHEIFKYMVWHYLSDSERDYYAEGVLSGRMKDAHPHVLSDRELEILEWTLKAVRTGGWFADWLERQVQTIATGSHPDDLHPAPLKIAASLVNCIQEFEEQMEAARKMVRLRPDLLFPAPPATPEPAAVSEPPAQPAAKAAKARKPRKRAA